MYNIKTDVEVLAIYSLFKKEFLPRLNEVYDLEKRVLSQQTLFNKRQVFTRILDLFDHYTTLVTQTWAMIYSFPEEFNYVLDRWATLSDDESGLSNESNAFFLVEQFFGSLYMAVVSVSGYYSGTTKSKKLTNQLHDKYIHRMVSTMERIKSVYMI